MQCRFLSVLLQFAVAALCLFAAGPGLEAQATVPPASEIPVGGYRIAGTIVSKSDGHPLSRARVILRDEGDRQKFVSILTSSEGKFEFTGLPAGKYGLDAARQGFIAAGYNQHDQFATAIVTGAGFDTETLVVKLAPAARITGRVLDEAGEPVRRAMVTSYFDDHSEGVDHIRQFSGAQTDDLGMYEIGPLMPGTYYVSATAKPWYAVHPPAQPEAAAANGRAPDAAGQLQAAPQFATPVLVDRSLDVAYPVTYYPDVTDEEGAMPIPVRGGDHIHVDIHMNPVASLRLRFHIAEGPNHNYSVPQLEQPSFEGSAYFQTEMTSNPASGVVEITGIPAGRYNVHINGEGPAAVMNGVDITRDGEELDASTAEALSIVKVSMSIPGETSPPRILAGLRTGRRMIAGFEAFDSKEELQFEQVPSGRYEVVVLGTSKPYSISHISAEGAVVAGHTLTLTAGSTALVALTLAGGSSDIRGVVQHEGKPFAGAMVVLVPKSLELGTDLFRRDQSDLDGTFRLRGVVPGLYTVIAIDDGWDLDWSQPGVISAYLKRGQSIEIGRQSPRSINLPSPVILQSK